MVVSFIGGGNRNTRRKHTFVEFWWKIHDGSQQRHQDNVLEWGDMSIRGLFFSDLVL